MEAAFREVAAYGEGGGQLPPPPPMPPLLRQLQAGATPHGAMPHGAMPGAMPPGTQMGGDGMHGGMHGGMHNGMQGGMHGGMHGGMPGEVHNGMHGGGMHPAGHMQHGGHGAAQGHPGAPMHPGGGMHGGPRMEHMRHEMGQGPMPGGPQHMPMPHMPHLPHVQQQAQFDDDLPPPLPPVPPPLPSGWVEASHPRYGHRPYFFNSRTRESTWDFPTGEEPPPRDVWGIGMPADLLAQAYSVDRHALQQLHNGRAALAHAASLSADCGAAAGEAAPTELTASPAIGDQLGCAVIIGAAKC